MAIAINAGGSGCNLARHEKWEPTENGCSNIEWVKATARVVSLTASPDTILANNLSTSTLRATVVDGDGYLVPPGIPTYWGTTNGSLSSYVTVTGGGGQTSITLRGTVAGWASVTAAAAAGAAGANVSLVPDPSTYSVVSLTPTAWSAPANGTPIGFYATMRDAYNNVPTPGQPTYWGATLGSLSTGVSYTDGNGVAYATVASSSPGGSTIYARSAVSGNTAVGVNFDALAPTAPICNYDNGGGHYFVIRNIATNSAFFSLYVGAFTPAEIPKDAGLAGQGVAYNGFYYTVGAWKSKTQTGGESGVTRDFYEYCKTPL
jgi:adhesin/invasin